VTADPVVTVCIPAYQAAEFIDRTLRCAREQTFDALRIAVSIDVSEDDTEAICNAHAREDDRIDVRPHRERLGWFGNVNHLLDAVTTELSFIYFHDDVIDPTYVEQLVAALRRRPDAASAHCDVVLDRPSGESVRPGSDYDGTATVRLLTHFVKPDRGALLRSMVRRGSPAGAAIHVAEPLYRRIDQRTGGLTDGWRRLPFEHFVEGCRYNAAMAREVIEDVRPTAEERELLEFGLAVYIAKRLRALERTYAPPTATPLEDVLGPGATLELPAAVDRLPDDLADLCRRAQRQLQRA
jgi:glycosyltransferase involved in cell wall biosynthesis